MKTVFISFNVGIIKSLEVPYFAPYQMGDPIEVDRISYTVVRIGWKVESPKANAKFGDRGLIQTQQVWLSPPKLELPKD